MGYKRQTEQSSIHWLPIPASPFDSSPRAVTTQLRNNFARPWLRYLSDLRAMEEDEDNGVLDAVDVRSGPFHWH